MITIVVCKLVALDGSGREERVLLATNDGPCPKNLPDCNEECTCIHEMSYAEGLYSPRYPMPAIPD